MILFTCTLQNKEIKQAKQVQSNVEEMKHEMEKLRNASDVAEKSSNKVTELMAEVAALRNELEREKEEKKDIISEKDLMSKQYKEVK